jgi:tRNA pseudouridine55 synthase
MNGVLVIDKPQGLTSHDVVAVARRVLRERRIGHTGTLDPLATGVLPLACGRATRLVRFFSASEKEYEAGILLGLRTDTFDVTGRVVARSDIRPSRDNVIAALESLHGDYLQEPPPYSAKKIHGARAYALARHDVTVQLAAVPVRVRNLKLLAYEGAHVRIHLTCSAGFYVRSFAHSLGERLKTGACLESLRRTRSGEFELHEAVTFEALQAEVDAVRRHIVAVDRLLASIPAVTMTDEGLRRVANGREVGPDHVIGVIPESAVEWVRMVREDGELVAVARAGGAPGLLHPAVVLI